MAVERHGSVRATPVDSDKTADFSPPVDRFVDKDAHLMTDEKRVYQSIGKRFAGHDWVHHGYKEYARGDRSGYQDRESDQWIEVTYD